MEKRLQDYKISGSYNARIFDPLENMKHALTQMKYAAKEFIQSDLSNIERQKWVICQMLNNAAWMA